MAKKRSETRKTKPSRRLTSARSGTRRRAQAEKPVLAAILLCESVLTDSTTGKQTLQGLLDRLVVSDPSKPVKPFSVFVKLYGGTGARHFDIQMVGPDGATISTGSQGAEVELKPDIFVAGCSVVRGLRVSQPGTYLVFQTVDGERIGEPARLLIHVPQVDRKNE